MSPSVRAWAVAVRGPRNRARAVRTARLAALAPRRRRARSQLAVEAACAPASAPGRPLGIHGGQFLEPVTFQAVHQPSQHQDPLGPHRIRQPVRAPGGQPINHPSQGHQLIRQVGRRPGRRLGQTAHRMCVRVHGGNLSSPHRKASTNPGSGDNFTSQPQTHPTDWNDRQPVLALVPGDRGRVDGITVRWMAAPDWLDQRARWLGA
jgi:hypothetical protein